MAELGLGGAGVRIGFTDERRWFVEESGMAMTVDARTVESTPNNILTAKEDQFHV